MLDLVLSDAEARRLSVMAGIKLPAQKRDDPTIRDRHVTLLRRFLRLLAGSYGVLRVIEGLLVLARTRKLRDALRATFAHSRQSLRTALCISSYPTLHNLTKLQFPQYATLSPLLNHGLLTLLSEGSTTQLNLYALTGLLAYLLGHKPRDATLRSLQATAASGGAWWLFPLAQAVLLPVAVFKHESFPSAWKKLTSAQAKRYLPERPATLSMQSSWPDPTTTMSLFPLLLSPTPFPSFPLPKSVDRNHYGPLLPVLDYANPAHTRAMCAVTHPDEVSCLKNWIGTVGDNTRGALVWVAGFNAVTMGIHWRKWRDDPIASLKAFAVATARYTGFVGMSLSTAWGLLCLLQRILPNNRLVFARFPLQAALASLWILLLPPKRRLDIGMYSMQAALLAAWQVVMGQRLKLSQSTSKLLQPLPLTLVMWFLMRRRKIAIARNEDEHSRQLKDASYIGRLVSWVDGQEVM